jgi:nucleoside-diphosphate-sugar epimerase
MGAPSLQPVLTILPWGHLLVVRGNIAVLEHLNPVRKAPSRVVIIGAGGFVGGAIGDQLAADKVPMLALTRKELDLLKPQASATLQRLLRADDSVVFVSALAPTRNNAMLIDNLRMAEAICAALSAQPVAQLVYISSDAVYADDANPVTERSCQQPSSLHGAMHLAREIMLRATLKLPLAILRPTLIYGTKDPHNGYGPNRFRRLAAKGEAITLFGEGEEKRDHVHVDDVAALVGAVLQHRSTGALNIATGRSASFREVAEMIAALSSRSVEIRGTPRQNPITHRHFDITDCLKAFPEFHCISLRDGLARVAKEGA